KDLSKEHLKSTLQRITELIPNIKKFDMEEAENKLTALLALEIQTNQNDTLGKIALQYDQEYSNHERLAHVIDKAKKKSSKKNFELMANEIKSFVTEGLQQVGDESYRDRVAWCLLKRLQVQLGTLKLEQYNLDEYLAFCNLEDKNQILT